MTDKVIDNLLGIINSEKIFHHNKYSEKRDELTLFELFRERRRLLYLENDLKLIKVIGETESQLLYSLTKRGFDVIKNNGWIKFEEKESYKKKWKNIKSLASFWSSIIIPILALVATVYSLKITENYQLQKFEDKEYIKEIELRVEKLQDESEKNKTLYILKTETDSLENE